jgi:hypothetical protein
MGSDGCSSLLSTLRLISVRGIPGACVRLYMVRTEADGTVCYAVRTFGTMTDEVLALADWLSACEVSHVAMASTGVSWNLVWNLLDDGFAWLLVNARHGLAVPGRTLDIHNCAWLAELLRHGLLKGSVVPERPQRKLQELTCSRSHQSPRSDRGGPAKPTIAVAHSILIIAYHLPKEGTVYCDLGSNSFDERVRQAMEPRLVHRLEGLGYRVALESAALLAEG